MKLKNVVLLVVSGALAVLLSGCGAKDCPDSLVDDLSKAFVGLMTNIQGKTAEEVKQICLAEASQFKQHDGCKWPEKNKKGEKTEFKDESGEKMTHFSVKKFEDACGKIGIKP